MGSVFNAIFRPIAKFFALIRSFIIYKVRLDGFIATNFFDLIKKCGKLYTLSEEYIKFGMPRQYDAYGIYEGIPFVFNIEERLLRAGIEGTDRVIIISFFRFQKKKMIKILDECNEKAREDIPIFILRPWDSYKIGKLIDSKKVDDPYVSDPFYKEFEIRVGEVVNDMKGKTGAILYGPPGNGKSFIVRYLAVKYNLPIYLVAFDYEISNTDIIRMFSRVEGPCIVLFEDFDNYFDGRKPLMPKIKFSFDSILNSIDGVFTEHQGVVFILTANNLGKIDCALKQRPSRFQFIIKVDNPDNNVRERIFEKINVDGIIAKTDGYSLDMLLHIRDQLVVGKHYDYVLKNAQVFRGYLEEHRQWTEEEARRINKDGKEAESKK